MTKAKNKSFYRLKEDYYSFPYNTFKWTETLSSQLLNDILSDEHKKAMHGNFPSQLVCLVIE